MFFRYFDSKNDIPFGNFAAFLRQLEGWLGAQPDDRQMLDVIFDAVVRFNRVHTDGPVVHREPMALNLHTHPIRPRAHPPTTEWQAAFARYPSRPLGTPTPQRAPQGM